MFVSCACVVGWWIGDFLFFACSKWVFPTSKVRSAHPPNLSVQCRFNLFYVLFVFRFVSFFRLFFRFVFTFYVSVFVLFFVFFRFFSFFFLFFLLVCLPGTYFMHSPRLARPAPCMNTNLLLISVFGHEMRHETGMNSNRYRFKMDEMKTKEIRHDGNCWW